MSIANEITALNTNLANCYTACNTKGATIPQIQSFDNLATCINSITVGSSSRYGVGVSDIFGNVDTNGVLSAPSENIYALFTGVKDVALSGLAYTFYYNKKLITASFPDLEEVSGTDAFMNFARGCTGLTTVSMPNLETISGGDCFSAAFYNCNHLTSIDLSGLKSITSSGVFSSAFYGCSNLTSVTFTALDSINNNTIFANAFQNCTRLASISFPALKSTSFGSSTSQFRSMLQGVNGCTVHFPSNLQSVIGSWSDVTGGFGGTNTTVLFDLTATT